MFSFSAKKACCIKVLASRKQLVREEKKMQATCVIHKNKIKNSGNFMILEITAFAKEERSENFVRACYFT